MKLCCECRENKPFDDFHKSAKHGGFSPRCKPCNIKVAGEWYVANKDRKRAYDAARREAQRERYREASRRHRQANPGKKNADTSSRRRRLRTQMPVWTSPKKLKCFYESAMRVSVCIGIKHHVDHVIPLKNESVCGLHVPENLRVIPAVANMVKHNRYNIEGIK